MRYSKYSRFRLICRTTSRKENILFPEKAVSKFLLIIVLFFIFSQVNAQQNNIETPKDQVSILTKTISLDLKNVQIEDVLKNISLNFGVNFTYVNNDIPLSKIVSVNAENQSLSLVLESIFRGHSIKQYEIETQILLKKEDEILQNSDFKDSIKSPELPFDTLPPTSHFENARYSVLEKGKYIKYYSFENFFRLKFKTIKRKKYEFQTSTNQQVKIDSLNRILKDSTVSIKIKRKVIKQKRKIKSKAKPYYKVVLGFYGAPEISFRDLKGSETEYVSDRNKMEDWRWNYSTGISLDYFFNKHWYLRSGLSYLNFGEIGKYRVYKPYILPNQELNTDTIISYDNNLSMFGIPVCLGFKTNGRLSFGVNAGVIFGFLPKQSTTYPNETSETYIYTSEYVINPRFTPQFDRPNPFDRPPPLNPNFQKGSIPNNQLPNYPLVPPFRLEATYTEVYSITTTAYYYRDYLDPRKHALKNLHFISTISFDLGYEFSKKVSVALSPTFNYFLSSIYTKSDKMNEKPFSFGIKAGVFFKLGKRRWR